MHANIHFFLAIIEAVAIKRISEKKHACISGFRTGQWQVEPMATQAGIMTLFVRCTQVSQCNPLRQCTVPLG